MVRLTRMKAACSSCWEEIRRRTDGRAGSCWAKTCLPWEADEARGRAYWDCWDPAARKSGENAAEAFAAVVAASYSWNCWVSSWSWSVNERVRRQSCYSKRERRGKIMSANEGW